MTDEELMRRPNDDTEVLECLVMTGNRRIDRITTPGYMTDIESRPMDELRSMKDESIEEESSLSYARKMIHARIEILRAELDRRAGKGGSLIDKLAAILADDGPQSSRGSFPTLDPDLSIEHPKRRIEKLISDDTLVKLDTLDSKEIDRIIATLSDTEREVSEQRKVVHEILDKINAEIVRRYSTGEADPADLLSR
ncbi:MAG: RsiG family protein [Actinomycetota bacterium]